MDELRRALSKEGARRAKARSQALDASRAIAQLARQALEAGLTKQEIAQLAQISRPALDDLLKRPPDGA